jgi:5-methylcytosine-specific restriction endonuclease McrA
MRTCELDNCDRPHLAKGLCGSHYNQQHHPNRHNKTIEVNCAQCGVAVTRNYRATRWGNNFCSHAHRDEYRWAKARASHKQLTIYAPAPLSHRVVTQMGKPISTSTRVAWVAGVCADCDAPFIDNQPKARYCSARCTNRSGRRRRRALEHNESGVFRYSDIMRQYRRQGYACAYCKQPCGGLPDPEHVTPLSRGGRNEMTNLVAACRSCNADKSDLTLTEWAQDRMRRRIAALDTELSDAAYLHLVASTPSAPAYRHRESA